MTLGDKKYFKRPLCCAKTFDKVWNYWKFVTWFRLAWHVIRLIKAETDAIKGDICTHWLIFESKKGQKYNVFPFFLFFKLCYYYSFFSSCKWENSAKNMSRKSIHTFLSYVLADAAPIWKIIKILEFKETNILAHFWFKMTHSI